jgi:CHAT domain-containing protein
LGDTVSLLWVVDQRGFDVFEIPNREALRGDVESLRDAVQRPGAGDAALREKARKLYRSLVEPAAPRLSKVERLVIVPDGFLFEVPFEMLLTAEPFSEADWRDLPYLTRDFDTVYAPSASTFLMIAEVSRSGKYGIELLAFGDPDFSRFSRGPAMGLPVLPFSGNEVERIGSRLSERKKRVYLGEEASEAALEEVARSGPAPRILHLATHGIVDRAEPNASCVVLAPGPGDSNVREEGVDEGEDGYLRTLEILSLRLGERLAVLSACESAEGQVSRGEGVVGLSRAFLASGAGGVVASLWAVSDESTSELMAAFYDEMLGEKRSACRALRKGRVALIAGGEYAHPFYWAPFVLTGTLETPW